MEPAIMFTILGLWVVGTVVSNWIESSSTILVASSQIASIQSSGDVGMLTGAWDKITGFIGAVVQALTWDYSFLQGDGLIMIARIIGWCLTAGFIVSLVYVVMWAKQILKL